MTGQRRELARVAVLSRYQLVADRLGLDTRPLLKAAGLTTAILADREQFVPARPIADMFEESARLSGCPTFGLQMAMERTVADMGKVSVLVALQPNFDGVLLMLCRYRNSILPILAFHVEKHGDIAVVSADVSLKSKRPYRQINDLLLGFLVGLARSFLGNDWNPECTYIPYPEPDRASRAVYHRAFGRSIQFNADFNGISLLVSDLERPRLGADPALAEHAAMLVKHMLDPGQTSFVQRVQQAIIYLLGTSRATVAETAQTLAMHPRTLQRRLEAAGVTFRELVHEARMQQVARFLANPNLRINEVAEALGYSSTGAFSRWYRTEFGQPPTQGRREETHAVR
jgi:AraC-like DNA-binding protein